MIQDITDYQHNYIMMFSPIKQTKKELYADCQSFQELKVKQAWQFAI